MGATNVGVRRAHPYSWSLSSPQQPHETEDSPTVSSCPTIYLARRMPCKRLLFKEHRELRFPIIPDRTTDRAQIVDGLMLRNDVSVSKSRRKISTAEQSSAPKRFLNHTRQLTCIFFD